METDALGVVRVARSLSLRDLSLALVCASGGSHPPRGERLIALADRLAAPGDVTAVLAGARVEARGDRLTVLREAGEFARRPPRLTDGVWDGRFEIDLQPGETVRPAAGLRARLSPKDQAYLAALPAALRPILPVLFRNPEAAPILARGETGLRSLVGDRLALAQGGLSHEGMLARPSDGGTPYEGLSWRRQDRRPAPMRPDREIEKRNEPA
jgi:tRNA(Ile)-lysidine synthase